jgi:hypothetical protein
MQEIHELKHLLYCVAPQEIERTSTSIPNRKRNWMLQRWLLVECKLPSSTSWVINLIIAESIILSIEIIQYKSPLVAGFLILYWHVLINFYIKLLSHSKLDNLYILYRIGVKCIWSGCSRSIRFITCYQIRICNKERHTQQDRMAIFTLIPVSLLKLLLIIKVPL